MAVAKSRRLLLPFIIALVAWFALGLQLYILISNVPENGLTIAEAIGRFFIFFTILTNLLVAIATTFLTAAPSSAGGMFFSKPSTLTAITVYIFIVGLIYNLVLRGLWAPGGLQKLADELLHVVVPLLFILYWFLFSTKHSLGWKHSINWLAYPAFYFIYALTRGSMEGFYPYPFLNVHELGYNTVLRNAGVILFAFIIIGLVFIFIANKIQKN